MSFSGNQHNTPFPAVPPSLSAGDHGMRDYYTAEDNATRATPNTVQNITPYLGLRSRLSQVWINRWTILLFLILVRILIAISGLNHDLASAKTEAMGACSGVESMGSAMASMPHYLAGGVNELAAAGVEKAVHGLMSLLLLTITGVEELIVFYVNMLTSTYMCLITLAVSGSLHVALKVIEEVADFVNNTLKGISDDLGKAVDGFEGDFNKFTGALNSIPKVFGGGDGKIPKINLDKEQKALSSLQLPSTLDQGLHKLNDSIPDFKEVQEFTDDIIRLPFEEVKKLINGSLHFSFNRSMLPIPEKKRLTFCTDDSAIPSFFDNLAKLIYDARKAFIAVLVITAVAVCIPMAYREMRRYRTMKERSQLVHDKSFDPMDVIYIASRPHTASVGIRLSSPVKDTTRQVLVRWVIAYATSTPALVVLSLGITGLLSCLCQHILLLAIQKEVPELANQVGQFVDKVVGALDNASTAWANDTNAAVIKVNNDINHDVFGWVNTTTGAVNGTLNSFIEHTTDVLNKTFGNTVLYDPIHEVFNCLIGYKIEGIQKGLTWVSNNAKVSFPLLSNDTFSLGAAAAIADDSPGDGKSQSFLADPGGKTTDKITRAVGKVVTHLSDGIRTEAIISTCILLIWVIVLLLGIGRAVWLALRSGRVRAEGGPAPSDGIPLGDRHTTMMNGPAPAYEPPRSAEHVGPNPFNDPDAIHPVHTNRSISSESDEHLWQDEKLGFAGQRAPTTEDPHPGTLRRSVYPTFEKTG